MEKSIKIYLLIFILVFIFLYSLEIFLEPKLITIKEIDRFKLNKNVHFEAEIINSRSIAEHTLLTLKNDNQTISAMLFYVENLEFEKGIKYKFKAKVSLYKKEIQVIVSDVKR